MELEIKKVTFTFADGSEKILEGKELLNWEVICSFHSDYLLPGAPDHILALGHNGVVRGFIPADKVAGTWKKI